MNRKHIEIINKRQEEIERRLDRSWRPKSGGRVLRGGNIVYDVSSRMGGVSSGGLGLIVQLVKRLRVAERIDERVRVLKRHLPYRESDHVLNLIYNVMSGGDQRQIEFPQRRLEIPTQGLKKKSCSRPLRRPFPRSSFL